MAYKALLLGLFVVLAALVSPGSQAWLPWPLLHDLAWGVWLALSLSCAWRACYAGDKNRNVAQALNRVGEHALDVTVNNASMMSSFTRVVALSREQGHILQNLHQSVDGLNSSADTVTQASLSTQQEVEAMTSLASQGDTLVCQTTEHMASLENSAQELDGRFREVKAHTQAIEGILSIIHNVSMQTNLLSLNAAVEAARAGEAGRGFAVVADEVRQLAQRTNTATVDIRRMVEHITASTQAADLHLQTVLGDIQASVQNTRSTSAALTDICERAAKTLESATTLAHAIDSQSHFSQALREQAQQQRQKAEESVQWVGSSNNQLRVVQLELGRLKNEITSLQPPRYALDVLMDCIEEMRACNILVMNAENWQQAEPVAVRIAQLDSQLDSAWQPWQNRYASQHQAGAQAFSQALHAYRQVRNQVLELARQGDFARVRVQVPQQVRPAYDHIKAMLTELQAVQKPNPSAVAGITLPGRQAVAVLGVGKPSGAL
ncbi:MAG: MCP four helix bundle domain-containing protein [Comamonas sp.]|nr:MCP four helix bundle domain-containing protein [Comamonas sp.]